MSLCILIGYSSTFIAGGMGDLPMTALQSVMITTFGIVFYLTSLFSILRTRGVTNTVDGAVALLNAGFALLWIIGEIQPELIPIYIAIVGLIYAVGFFLLYKVTNVYTSFLIYGGVALGMLTTAIMYELSGRSLAYVLLFMGALVTVFTYHLSRDEKITKIIALFNLLPFFHVLIAMNTVFEVIMYNKPQENVWKDVLVMVIAITVYFGLFRYFKDRSKKLGQVALFVVIAGSITLLWQVLHLLIGGMFASSLAALITGVGLTIFAQVYFDNDEAIIKKFALINSITVLYGLISLGRIGDSLSSSYYMVDVWKDWVFVFLVMGTSLAFYFYYTNKIKAISRPALTASLFFLSVSVWQVFHLVLPEGIATFISVLIYTLVGLTTLFLGSRDGNTTMVKISRIWLGFVAARVILWDAWQTGSVTAGVFICVVTGVLLLSSSFIVKKVTQ